MLGILFQRKVIKKEIKKGTFSKKKVPLTLKILLSSR